MSYLVKAVDGLRKGVTHDQGATGENPAAEKRGRQLCRHCRKHRAARWNHQSVLQPQRPQARATKYGREVRLLRRGAGRAHEIAREAILLRCLPEPLVERKPGQTPQERRFPRLHELRQAVRQL